MILILYGKLEIIVFAFKFFLLDISNPLLLPLIENIGLIKERKYVDKLYCLIRNNIEEIELTKLPFVKHNYKRLKI